jgi:hypothetical protein
MNDDLETDRQTNRDSYSVSHTTRKAVELTTLSASEINSSDLALEKEDSS